MCRYSVKETHVAAQLSRCRGSTSSRAACSVSSQSNNHASLPLTYMSCTVWQCHVQVQRPSSSKYFVSWSVLPVSHASLNDTQNLSWSLGYQQQNSLLPATNHDNQGGAHAMTLGSGTNHVNVQQLSHKHEADCAIRHITICQTTIRHTTIRPITTSYHQLRPVTV